MAFKIKRISERHPARFDGCEWDHDKWIVINELTPLLKREQREKRYLIIEEIKPGEVVNTKPIPFNELKKIPNHEHDCGRPGVNGGYMKKKDLKFGVNCYGKKPFATDKDIDFMNKHTLIHVSDEKIKAEKDKKISKFLVAPFNKEKWAELM